MELLRLLFAREPRLSAFERGMLAKLPPFDPAWPQEVQDAWQRCIAPFVAKLSTPIK